MTRFTRLFALVAAVATLLLADPSRADGSIRVNAQPLPPVHSHDRSSGANATVNVNPQPPRPIHPGSRVGSPNALVDVNPQPLPPRS